MPRPTHSAAWAASKKIYDPINPGKKVAQVIGGHVAKNIDAPDGWENTCAVRMSYILNYCGVSIPQIRNATVSGGDKKQYFFRVPDLIQFLQQQWGNPDLVVKTPAVSNAELAKEKGVILFEINGWSNARGHATLWSGSQCYDHCYFNERGADYRTDKANFWRLP